MATFGTTSVLGSHTDFCVVPPRATRYTPSQNGTVTSISLYITGSAAGRHAQVAIYTDSGNVPNTLLGSSASEEIASDGWHTWTGFNVAVTAGTVYWLANQADSTSLQWYYANNAGGKYVSGPGSYGSFPNPFGTTGGAAALITSIYATYSTGIQKFCLINEMNY